MGYLDLARKAKEEYRRKHQGAVNPDPPIIDDLPTIDFVIGDKVVAVLIDSTILGSPVWFAFDDAFTSGDDIPVFFASELQFLRQMTEAELRRRYEDKRALGGGWIRDRTEEPTKH